MSKEKELPLRNEVPEELTWDLTPMFSSDTAWEEEFKSLSEDLESISKYKGTLGDSATTLLEGLKFRDDLYYRLGILYVYAHLRFDVDTTNGTYQAMNARIQALYAKVVAAFSYYNTELLSYDRKLIEGYLQELEALGLYEQEFDSLFKAESYILSEKEERLLAKASESFSTPSNVFGMLNNADIEFPKVKDGDTEIQLSHGRYALLMEDTNRDLRRQAFEGMNNTYGKYKNTLAATLSGNVKNHNFNADIRGFDSARHSALFNNSIDESVHDALIGGITDNIDLLHKYVEVRKKALELDTIAMYDIYVPMVDATDLNFTYEEAQELILEALSVLGEEYRSVLKKAFNERWIDVVENKGKRSGAYSSGTYGTNPYILLNWQENLDNVFTLAHELGHSVHSYLTRKYQPFIYGDYSIFLAEIASTTNENLLLNYLLDQYKDNPKVTAYLLNHYLDTVKGTVFRQTQFAEFEHIIHKADQEGVALTADFLTQTYLDLNKKYYGEEITNPEIGFEWARIPHFYYNYYVYQYATGFSAATLFSERIYNGENPELYLDFLKAGCSDYPLEVLKKAGVDMTQPTAVETTLNKFKDSIDKLETMI